MRVLSAIAEQPRRSNRDVADAAGITDLGQISKLLGRLARLGLIENVAPNTKGFANAWLLTERGIELQVAVAKTFCSVV
jgi:DNA-binding MarR family transcriptional regulator